MALFRFLFFCVLFLPMYASAIALAYPETAVENTVETLHGVLVKDPYRWLEDTDSDRTAAWIKDQNKLTFSYLEGIPERGAIRERLMRLWNYPRYSVPFQENGRYFFRKNSGLQNQAVLFTQESLEAEPEVLVDPNTFSEKGTVSLTVTSVSRDGEILGFGKSEGGSDWQEFHFKRISGGEMLPDRIRRVKNTGISWTADNLGFFYTRFTEIDESDPQFGRTTGLKLFYHRLGTEEETDQVVYERSDDPDLVFSGWVSEDGRFLWISTRRSQDNHNLLSVIDLGDPKDPRPDNPVRHLVEEFRANYLPFGNVGSRVFLRSNEDAPRGKVLAVDMDDPNGQMEEVLPQGEEVLHSVQLIAGRLVIVYIKDAQHKLRFFNLSGRPSGGIDLPGPGSVGGVSGKADGEEMFYSFTSFLYPPTLFRYDFSTQENGVFQAPDLDFPVDEFETRQLFYTSGDGTRVPMFVTHRKGTSPDESHPTLLYVYGGFNLSMMPGFSPANAAFLEGGGVYAVANVRGGGEYGKEWHLAGTKEKKQNTFDDVIAAAEHLIAEGITTPKQLALMGGSNGGMVVGAVANQRPDLFGAVVPVVGVMDMLRFHRFGWGQYWISDYGSPENAREFRILLRYSPLHNIRYGVAYPAILAMTADSDDRVKPSHSFKYISAMQAAATGPRPTLIRVETDAGHGAGTATDKAIEGAADRLAFILDNLRPAREGKEK